MKVKDESHSKEAKLLRYFASIPRSMSGCKKVLATLMLEYSPNLMAITSLGSKTAIMYVQFLLRSAMQDHPRYCGRNSLGSLS